MATTSPQLVDNFYIVADTENRQSTDEGKFFIKAQENKPIEKETNLTPPLYSYPTLVSSKNYLLCFS